MNQDDCLKLARENGAMSGVSSFNVDIRKEGKFIVFAPDEFAAYNKAHADKVREECAKVCEEFDFNNRVEISEPCKDEK